MGPVGLTTIATRVTTTPDGRHLHTATLVGADGVAWDFDCTHLHLTPAAAMRCAQKLRNSWVRWAAAERTPVTPGPEGLVELRLGPVTRRIRPVGRVSAAGIVR